MYFPLFWNKVYCRESSLPLHDRTLHFVLSEYFPLQFFPFPDGGGLVHSRLRVFLPLPQVLLHAEYSDHGENPPSTEML